MKNNHFRENNQNNLVKGCKTKLHNLKILFMRKKLVKECKDQEIRCNVPDKLSLLLVEIIKTLEIAFRNPHCKAMILKEEKMIGFDCLMCKLRMHINISKINS
jgi:hypothetical protein